MPGFDLATLNVGGWDLRDVLAAELISRGKLRRAEKAASCLRAVMEVDAIGTDGDTIYQQRVTCRQGHYCPRCYRAAAAAEQKRLLDLLDEWVTEAERTPGSFVAMIRLSMPKVSADPVTNAKIFVEAERYFYERAGRKGLLLGGFRVTENPVLTHNVHGHAAAWVPCDDAVDGLAKLAMEVFGTATVNGALHMTRLDDDEEWTTTTMATYLSKGNFNTKDDEGRVRYLHAFDDERITPECFLTYVRIQTIIGRRSATFGLWRRRKQVDVDAGPSPTQHPRNAAPEFTTNHTVATDGLIDGGGAGPQSALKTLPLPRRRGRSLKEIVKRLEALPRRRPRRRSGHLPYEHEMIREALNDFKFNPKYDAYADLVLLEDTAKIVWLDGQRPPIIDHVERLLFGSRPRSSSTVH